MPRVSQRGRKWVFLKQTTSTSWFRHAPICVCVCVCMLEWAHMLTHTCVEARGYIPVSYLRQSLLLNPRLTFLARLAGHQDPSDPPLRQCWCYSPPSAAADLSAGPQVYAASICPAELSPQPCCGFLEVVMLNWEVNTHSHTYTPTCSHTGKHT